MDPNASLRRHALQQATTLLRRLAYEVGRTAKSGDAASIHDLRVAIRRLAQCLRVFKQLFPRDDARTIRRRLKEMVDLASEVRNRDVALELLAKAKIGGDSDLARRLSRDRRTALRALVTTLNRSTRGNSFRKWRSSLGL